MNTFMRSIGFSERLDYSDTETLLQGILEHSTRHDIWTDEYGDTRVEFDRDVATGMGVAACGLVVDDETDSNSKRFLMEYCFPYLVGRGVTLSPPITVMRHAQKVSYAGISEDAGVGGNIIFYLQNMLQYMRHEDGPNPSRHLSGVSLSGLALSGTVLLPLHKNPLERLKSDARHITHAQLVSAARGGDESARETLTTEEMNIYDAISRRIVSDDVLTLVDTSIIPYGVECDQYTVIGEITELATADNLITGESVARVTVECNGLRFDICVNMADIYGEPAVGRRFKAVIWLQGRAFWDSTSENMAQSA